MFEARALFGGLLIGGIVYAAVAIVASMSVATDRLAGSDGPLLEVVQLGPLAVDCGREPARHPPRGARSAADAAG